MTHTVLVTVPTLDPAGVDVLSAAGLRVLYVAGEQPQRELERLMEHEQIDAVISRTLPLNSETIEKCRALKVISRHGIGFDNVDVAAATRRSIPVTICAGTNAGAVAELALGLTLAVARNIVRLDGAVRAGAWPRTGVGLQLSGRMLGLVGCGRIARRFGEMAKGLGMDVIAYDPHSTELPDGFGRATSLLELLTISDVVSLHCPLTPETRHMIDRQAIAHMRKGAILINTARGALIDEGALSAALASGQLSGAGLDTLEEEQPRPTHPLLANPNIVITPHIGGSSDIALADTARAAARNVVEILAGRTIDARLVVNGADLATLGRG